MGCSEPGTAQGQGAPAQENDAESVAVTAGPHRRQVVGATAESGAAPLWDWSMRGTSQTASRGMRRPGPGTSNDNTLSTHRVPSCALIREEQVSPPAI